MRAEHLRHAEQCHRARIESASGGAVRLRRPSLLPDLDAIVSKGERTKFVLVRPTVMLGLFEISQLEPLAEASSAPFAPSSIVLPLPRSETNQTTEARQLSRPA